MLEKIGCMINSISMFYEVKSGRWENAGCCSILPVSQMWGRHIVEGIKVVCFCKWPQLLACMMPLISEATNMYLSKASRVKRSFVIGVTAYRWHLLSERNPYDFQGVPCLLSLGIIHCKITCSCDGKYWYVYKFDDIHKMFVEENKACYTNGHRIKSSGIKIVI